MNLNRRFPLLPGSHPTRDDGMCAMEMVAWLAGQEHSDGPACTCPVIAAFVRAFNDFLPDAATRDRYLRRLLPRLINTVGSRTIEKQRGYLAADRAVRALAPAVLEQRGEHELAVRLRGMPAIVDEASARAAASALPPGTPRSVSWIVARAADGSPPVTWVSAAAHTARAAGSERAWNVAAALIGEMVEVGTPSRRRPQRSSGSSVA